MSDPLTLDEYQRRAADTDLAAQSGDPLLPLLGLGGEVGALIAEFKKQRRADGVHYLGFDVAVSTELGDILWYLAALARHVGLSLDDVARQNLNKTRSRWLPPGELRTSFDADFPVEQQLPRQFDVVFQQTGEQVSMTISGSEIGDPINDNSRGSDFYRYHDVFHLAYATVLGWSPILRALLRRKRKADELIDRVEDGARARATEEAIAALVFKLAEPHSFFDGQQRVDDSILRAVEAVASGLEARTRSKAEWEAAILQGFAIWRELRKEGQGLVTVDLDARALTFAPEVP